MQDKRDLLGWLDMTVSALVLKKMNIKMLHFVVSAILPRFLLCVVEFGNGRSRRKENRLHFNAR